MKNFSSDKLKPDCSHCKNFMIWEEGDGYHEPRYTEVDCNSAIASEEEIDKYLGEEAEDVSKCRGFTPILILKCNHCSKPMNIPTYQAKFSDCVYETQYYCSQDCKDESWEEFKKDMNI